MSQLVTGVPLLLSLGSAQPRSGDARSEWSAEQDRFVLPVLKRAPAGFEVPATANPAIVDNCALANHRLRAASLAAESGRFSRNFASLCAQSVISKQKVEEGTRGAAMTVPKNNPIGTATKGVEECFDSPCGCVRAFQRSIAVGSISSHEARGGADCVYQ
jgi:hypothetical protein